MVGLYRLVQPDFDRIAEFKDFPTAGAAVIAEIFDKAIDFDNKHHPNVVAGGAWLNSGFSTDPNMDPWEVKPTTAVTYHHA